MPNTPPPADPQLALGRRIYYNGCVFCHGVEGRGQGFLVCTKSPLQGKNFKPDEIIKIVERPKFPMPPLRMTKSEQEALAKFVYVLERGPAAAAAATSATP